MLTDLERIDHMIEVIDHLLEITAGMTVDEYISSIEKQYAVKYALIMLGEDAASISDAIKNQFPNVPWRSIRAMRNMIAHDYVKTDDEIVFQTVITDITPLREQLISVKKAI